MTKNLVPTIVVALVVVLAVVYIINIANTTGLVLSLNEKVEAQRPANLEIIKLSDQSCPKCFNVDPVIASLKGNNNVKVVKESSIDVNSPEGKQLAIDLNIQNAPTVVVKGEFNKENVKSLWVSGWKVEKNGVLFEQILPPYLNLNTKSVTGLVDVTILNDSSCEKCFDFQNVVNFFEQNGVVLKDKKVVDFQSIEGQALIKQFNINKIPVLVVTNNIKEYPQVSQLWGKIPLTEKEGLLIIDPLLPPYKDLATNTVKGLVNAIFLKDDECKDCFDVVAVNKQVLVGAGLVLASEKTVNISSIEGKELIEKYNITQVPTALLSPETSEYVTLAQVWSQVGTQEKDGWFVERNLKVFGVYKDLTTNTTVSK